jgi:hypothetical protein
LDKQATLRVEDRRQIVLENHVPWLRAPHGHASKFHVVQDGSHFKLIGLSGCRDMKFVRLNHGGRTYLNTDDGQFLHLNETTHCIEVVGVTRPQLLNGDELQVDIDDEASRPVLLVPRVSSNPPVFVAVFGEAPSPDTYAMWIKSFFEVCPRPRQLRPNISDTILHVPKPRPYCRPSGFPLEMHRDCEDGTCDRRCRAFAANGVCRTPDGRQNYLCQWCHCPRHYRRHRGNR